MTSTAQTPIRVAAIDPDAVTRRLLALYLEPRGIQVLALESLEQMRNAPPNAGCSLLLIDAFTLSEAEPAHLERLKRACGTAPIYLMTEPGPEAPAFPHGLPIAGRIQKPIKPGALLALLPGGGGIEADRLPDAAGGEADPVLEGFQELIAEMEMDRQMIDELSESFIVRGEEYLHSLGALVEREDAPEIDKVSHAMKGMSGNLRFHNLVEMCDQIAQASKNGQLQQCAEILQQMDSEFTRIRAAIRQRWPEGA